jgi:hypothetical protein
MTDAMRALVFEEIGRTAVMENRPGNVQTGPDSDVPSSESNVPDSAGGTSLTAEVSHSPADRSHADSRTRRSPSAALISTARRPA